MLWKSFFQSKKINAFFQLLKFVTSSLQMGLKWIRV